MFTTFSTKSLVEREIMRNFANKYYNGIGMTTNKMTREEALKRWNAAKATKRKMMDKLEALARESYKERTGEYPISVEVW